MPAVPKGIRYKYDTRTRYYPVVPSTYDVPIPIEILFPRLQKNHVTVELVDGKEEVVDIGAFPAVKAGGRKMLKKIQIDINSKYKVQKSSSANHVLLPVIEMPVGRIPTEVQSVVISSFSICLPVHLRK